MKKSDEQIAQEAKALFDASVDELDAATLSTLNQGRHRALRSGAVATRRTAALGAGRRCRSCGTGRCNGTLPGSGTIEVMPSTVADMEILLGEDSLEMFEELEFYSVLDVMDQGDDVG